MHVDTAGAQQKMDKKPVRTITVRGEAKRNVSPDEATVNFSIVTRSKDPNLARSLNAEAGSRAISAIESTGIPSKAIRLQNLALTPAREWNPDRRTYEELGFDVSRSVEVTVDDLDLVGEVVVKVVESGANRLQGVRYGLKSETEIRTQVLADAVTSAKSRAEAMVSALDTELGQVITISEESMSVPTPYFGAERMMVQKASADESQALPAGEIEVSATVSVTFAIR
jgi:uncharacterized protein YggE